MKELMRRRGFGKVANWPIFIAHSSALTGLYGLPRARKLGGRLPDAEKHCHLQFGNTQLLLEETTYWKVEEIRLRERSRNGSRYNDQHRQTQ